MAAYASTVDLVKSVPYEEFLRQWILPPDFWLGVDRNGGGYRPQRRQFWDECGWVERGEHGCSHRAGYLDEYARGPGRGWFVLGRARCFAENNCAQWVSSSEVLGVGQPHVN